MLPNSLSQLIPSTSQVTESFGFPLTVTVNDTVPLAWTLVSKGETDTLTGK